LPAEAQITPRLRCAGGQVGDLVVGAAQLEAEHRLHVLALEQDPVAAARRQDGRQLQRRFDGHVIDAGVEDFFEVVHDGGVKRFDNAQRVTWAWTSYSTAEAGLAGLFLASFLAATLLPGGSEAVLAAVLLAHPEQAHRRRWHWRRWATPWAA
jgi:hypothetical protein